MHPMTFRMMPIHQYNVPGKLIPGVAIVMEISYALATRTCMLCGKIMNTTSPFVSTFLCP